MRKTLLVNSAALALLTAPLATAQAEQKPPPQPPPLVVPEPAPTAPITVQACEQIWFRHENGDDLRLIQRGIANPDGTPGGTP